MVNVPAKPDMLRTAAVQSDRKVGVDREALRINGFVVAETGDFKDKRGHFSTESLQRIVDLGNATQGGLKSRLSHPNESDDGVTKHLGRVTNFTLDPDGQRVRADLQIAQIAMREPVGGGMPLGEYVLSRAEEDPGSIGSSLVLRSEKLERKTADGKQAPDLWTPTELLASDIVADGDAVHGDLLSAEALDEFFQGSERRIETKLAVAGATWLNRAFPDAPRDVIESRFGEFLNRYLSLRFGPPEPESQEVSEVDKETQAAIAATNEAVAKLASVVESKFDALSKSIEADRTERTKQEALAKRNREITAVCELASSVLEKGELSKFIDDESLSVEDVRKTLYERLAKNNQPLADDADDKLEADHDRKFRAEYEQHRDLHEKLGVSVDKYVARRRKEEGLPAIDPKN